MIQYERTLDAYARVGGLMYLLIIAIYAGSEYLLGSFHVTGDFAETVRNIAAAEPLYRAGLALQLIASLATVLLGGAFYVLLKPVDRNLALMALLWRVAETVIGGVAVVFRMVALKVYVSSPPGPGPHGAQALAGLASSGARAAFPVSTMYFSVGSILFFYLLLKSRFIPRSLAALGLIASVMVSLMSLATIVLPREADAMAFLWAPIFIAEVVTGLWLLVKGVSFEWWNSNGPHAPSVNSTDAPHDHPAG